MDSTSCGPNVILHFVVFNLVANCLDGFVIVFNISRSNVIVTAYFDKNIQLTTIKEVADRFWDGGMVLDTFSCFKVATFGDVKEMRFWSERIVKRGLAIGEG